MKTAWAGRNVVLVDGARTPFGKMGGALRTRYMTDLGAAALRGLLARTGLPDRCPVDAVLAGSALHDVRSANPARYMALAAGLPVETTASFIEMQCGSALDCINHAGWMISAGAADVLLAGGADSYSQAFAKFSMSVEPYRLVPPMPVPNRIAPKEEDNIGMLEISDRMAETWGISRGECDAFAWRSQQRAAAALTLPDFADRVVSVEIPGDRRNPPSFCTTDEQLRPETTLEDLARLKPVLPGGVTTAGNASGRNDGAAFVLMMAEEKARELGYIPFARWIDGTSAGVPPGLMGIGPALSNVALLRKHGLSLADIDVFECNEAFAAQNLAVIKEMERLLGGRINPGAWNPNGGAIAYGHPNGASGARIALFAMVELRRRNERFAVVSSCCGGGMGVSTLIENLAM